ncbi:MAG: hypothetical protein HY725_17045 [Candidatus Rokubacteria bacterium]|nr:hypothetical protein [Candidatus Rokubacteria bacterium]
MDEPLAELRQRLDRLGREVRWWRLGATLPLMLAAAVLFMGQALQPTRLIEAERVLVKDKTGTIRVALGALGGHTDAPNPLYGITLYDPRGDTSAYIYDRGSLGGATLYMAGSQSSISFGTSKEASVEINAFKEPRKDRERRLDQLLRDAL